jgi:D-alanyl-D-alanine carboxypeptidase/D-alanyl-D-alanine-endopeptidase (penicillin-binding protein 4)
MKIPHLAIALALALGLHGASLRKQIDRELAHAEVARSSFWGIQVVDLNNGHTLYAHNADHFFVPASNTKLFTAAMALSRLGPGFTFQTRIMADQLPDKDGRIHGDLRLLGGGDPNLSRRAIPYQTAPPTGDPLAPIEDLANQVVARGVRRIDGDVVGDDTWYVWEPYADGWSIDDPIYDYGAPVSALILNDGTLTVTIRPGEQAGDPATVLLDPALEYYVIDNRVRTVAAGGERQIHYDRAPGGYELELWGTIPAGDRPEQLDLGQEDPARYAALALRQALEERGVTVTGVAVSRHRYPNDPDPPPVSGVMLAERTSAPLVEDLRITAKVSQNLHAEMALRAVARTKDNEGSREAGLAEMKAFLAEIGIGDQGYTFHDGSGLSRLNMVTPESVVKLLRFMYQGPQRDNWISLLPVGGEDGTLQSRHLTNRVHAKTGSLSHVSALSGYAVTGKGRWVAFSILVNNANAPAREVRGIMDRICTLIGK